jgi:CheY-like chemotaxis protein
MLERRSHVGGAQSALSQRNSDRKIPDDREICNPTMRFCSSSKMTRTMRACCAIFRATGIQSAGGDAWRGSSRARPRISPDRGVTGRLPPRHAGLDRAQPLETRSGDAHIPVQILTLDEDRHHGLARGAFRFRDQADHPKDWNQRLSRIKEYAAPRRKRLLVVEDNPAEQLSIPELLGYDDIDVTVVSSGEEAIRAVKRAALRLRRSRPASAGHLGLRGVGAFPRHAPAGRSCPSSSSPAKSFRPKKMPVCTPWRAASWSRESSRPNDCWTRPRYSCIASSPTFPKKKQNMLDRLHHSDDALVGKKVLVVDDDVRNIFALSSVLERRGMT